MPVMTLISDNPNLSFHFKGEYGVDLGPSSTMNALIINILGEIHFISVGNGIRSSFRSTAFIFCCGLGTILSST